VSVCTHHIRAADVAEIGEVAKIVALKATAKPQRTSFLPARYYRMTNEERQLLKDTAENLLQLLNKWDDTIGEMSVAIAELYRSGMTTPERKSFTLGRLKLRRDLMAKNGSGVEYLDALIADLEKWTGY